jgi:subtilisin family serine protease
MSELSKGRLPIMRLFNRSATLVPLIAGVLGLAASPSLFAQEKIKIKKLDDLPRHTYKVTNKVIDLVKSDEAFAKLADLVRKDVEADLAKFEIEDKTTLKRLHGLLMMLDLQGGHDEEALRRLKLFRDLEDNRALKLTAGLPLEAEIAARRETKNAQDLSIIGPVFRRHLEAKLATLPYDVVGDTIRQTKMELELHNENQFTQPLEEQVGAVVAKEGEISADLAGQILWVGFQLRRKPRFDEEIISVYQAYLDQHKKAKPDICGQRAVALAKESKYTPVLTAIWDSGVDVDLFKDQFVGGIAYDLDNRRTTGFLYPLGDAKSRLPELFRYLKGREDFLTGLATPEAREFRKKRASLNTAEMTAFTEDLELVGKYCHGTHIAGIALDGNPFARLVIARYTWDYHFIPRPLSIERAKAKAREWRETIDYFKEQRVRVVNMSWSYSLKEFQDNLGANRIGKDATERAALARKILDILKPALFEAIKTAPDILFIGSAGNENKDVVLHEFIPPSFDLQNLLVVGEVDQAGEPTSMTNFGNTVQVYAHGSEVESDVPGGQRLKMSGTSMAAPNVANLAGKILAIKPDLKPANVIALIKKGVTPAPGAKKEIPLIDPKRILSLLND